RLQPLKLAEQLAVHSRPQLVERDILAVPGEDAVDLVAGQTGQPGEDVVVAASGVVLFKLVEGAGQGFLYDLLAAVDVLADAVETEVIQGGEHGGRQQPHRLGVAGQRPPPPVAVEPCLHDRPPAVASCAAYSRGSSPDNGPFPSSVPGGRRSFDISRRGPSQPDAPARDEASPQTLAGASGW